MVRLPYSSEDRQREDAERTAYKAVRLRKELRRLLPVGPGTHLLGDHKIFLLENLRRIDREFGGQIMGEGEVRVAFEAKSVDEIRAGISELVDLLTPKEDDERVFVRDGLFQGRYAELALFLESAYSNDQLGRGPSGGGEPLYKFLPQQPAFYSQRDFMKLYLLTHLKEYGPSFVRDISFWEKLAQMNDARLEDLRQLMVAFGLDPERIAALVERYKKEPRIPRTPYPEEEAATEQEPALDSTLKRWWRWFLSH